MAASEEHSETRPGENEAMKQISQIVSCMILIGASMPAADQTWTGRISDDKCGASHDQMIAASNKELHTISGAAEHDCTLACIKDAAKYVFITNGKVYKIANQSLPALPQYAGQPLQVSGDLQGETITISKVTVLSSKP